ncbi:MAG: methyltransferase domain-containing protein [Dehalococcoidales bacterium]
MSSNLSKDAITAKVSHFYDLGSPLYLEVYGENIHDGYYVTGKESRREAQENLTRYIAGKARIKEGSRILDVGCGMGGSSIWLATNLKAKTVGITISPAQVEIARKLAKERKADSSFLLMDAENMHFPGTFDVMWVVASSTHFQDQKKFVKSATALLDRGGKFVVFDWMSNESVADIKNDRHLKPVAEGMLLYSLCSINSYLKWFIQAGYRITCSEDITGRTIQTWDDALSVIRDPSILRLASRITRSELAEVLHFLKSVRAMKLAMKKGKMKSGLIVAEKI